MMARSSLQMMVLLVWSAVTGSISAQSQRLILIDTGGENTQVQLSYLDAEDHRNLAKFFEIPSQRDLQPFILRLTNHSGQGIVALTIRWTGTSDGLSYIYDSSIDSFKLLIGSSLRTGGVPLPERVRPQQGPRLVGGSHRGETRSVVLLNGEHMLVAPGMIQREEEVRQRGAFSGSSMPDEIRTAESLTATIDLIVLEDGKVLGPDSSQTIENLLESKSVIDGVVAVVKGAEQNGQDGLDVLRQMANRRPVPGDGADTMQKMRIAHRLMNSSRWKEELEKLASIRLPDFHR